MTPKKINADALRAALRSTEERLKETLQDLESNDMDDQAVTDRLKEIEKGWRRLLKAA